MIIWPNHDYYNSQTPDTCAYTIFTPGLFETLFMGKSNGPKLELHPAGAKPDYWEIETKTHELRIYDSGKLEVRMKGWPDFYPVDDSIFGAVANNPPSSGEKEK